MSIQDKIYYLEHEVRRAQAALREKPERYEHDGLSDRVARVEASVSSLQEQISRVQERLTILEEKDDR